jgi:allantoin racemase
MKTLVIIPWPNAPLPGLPEGVESKALNDGVPLRGYLDVARNEHLFLDAVVQAEKDGYDAVLSLCFADTGIEVARKLVDIPVLGCTRVGIHVCGILGHKACVLQPDFELNYYTTKHTIDSYNMGDFAQIVNPGVDSMAAFASANAYNSTGLVTPPLQSLVDACVKSIKEDNTDVITFGSGALVGAENAIHTELKKIGYDIPVVNPMAAAIGLANVLSALKLTQSRFGYPRGV